MAAASPVGIDSNDILCDRRPVKSGGRPAAAPVASGSQPVGDLLPAEARVREGDLLWAPSPEQAARANVTHFTGWLAAERGLRFDDYDALWQWSVTDLDGFWQAVWDYSGIQASVAPAAVLGRRTMPGAEWFPGARLNYAEHVLRNERPGQDALLAASETAPLTALPWETLAGQVRVVATQLRAMGVRPGDRVASCLPNIPQTVIALLATASIGAVWTSCSPDFGWRGVLDRFRQLTPKVLLCVDGYRYAGRDHDRRAEVARIAGGLPGLDHVIYLPYLHPEDPRPPVPGATSWNDLLRHPAVPAAEFRFEQVPFGQPLWILFSSGTTGLPKAITHGHGGILIEQLKLQRFHMDLRPGDRMLFYTTTGWMMWNFLVSSLLLGVQPVLYDGNPAYPGPDVLWRLVQDAGVTFFGASPAYVDALSRAGVVPGRRFDLSALRAVMLAGSPVSAECSAWFYRNVKRDLWLATGSGGTDTCCGLVGGTPTLPVYAGEIQARHLGVAAFAFNERGESMTGEVGELVITEPMPSMPVRFWGDEEGRRYRASYFADFPGVWRQGDFFRVNARGGCFVLGRSDATLNRDGVRIGTAEIYAVLASIPEIDDALVVNLDRPDGRFFMPLFVRLAGGGVLDDRIRAEIRDRLRTEYTPRHVPDQIIQVPDIPTTLTGKKMEVPVRKILSGTPADAAANRNAMANPAALDAFVEYARSQQHHHRPG
jgi:acetoacetyl-CoA synthetase